MDQESYHPPSVRAVCKMSSKERLTDLEAIAEPEEDSDDVGDDDDAADI